jgi:hypothetical protein
LRLLARNHINDGLRTREIKFSPENFGLPSRS